MHQPTTASETRFQSMAYIYLTSEGISASCWVLTSEAVQHICSP
jgi:hypothetical protein